MKCYVTEGKLTRGFHRSRNRPGVVDCRSYWIRGRTYLLVLTGCFHKKSEKIVAFKFELNLCGITYPAGVIGHKYLAATVIAITKYACFFHAMQTHVFAGQSTPAEKTNCVGVTPLLLATEAVARAHNVDIIISKTAGCSCTISVKIAYGIFASPACCSLSP